MQVARLFADFFAREPFGVQKRLLTFWHLFGVFLTSFWRTKKGSRLFAVLFQKKGQQKVAEPILDAKRSVRKKDGKRLWHLHSALEAIRLHFEARIGFLAPHSEVASPKVSF